MYRFGKSMKPTERNDGKSMYSEFMNQQQQKNKKKIKLTKENRETKSKTNKKPTTNSQHLHISYFSLCSAINVLADMEMFRSFWSVAVRFGLIQVNHCTVHASASSKWWKTINKKKKKCFFDRNYLRYVEERARPCRISHIVGKSKTHMHAPKICASNS